MNSLQAHLSSIAADLTALLATPSAFSGMFSRMSPTVPPPTNIQPRSEETVRRPPSLMPPSPPPLRQEVIIRLMEDYRATLSNIGISAEAIQHILDLFQQDPSSNSNFLEDPTTGHVHREAALCFLRNTDLLPKEHEPDQDFFRRLTSANPARAPLIPLARLFRKTYFDPRTLSDPQDPQNPAYKIPGFTLIRFLGSGTQSVVFLAMDRNRNKTVVIKIGTETGFPFSGLTNEYRFQADPRLQHVAQALALGITRGRFPYMVLEYYPQGNLNIVRAHNHMSFEERVSLARNIILAVAEIHDYDIVHSDLKPGNILLDNQNAVYITDFGIACTTRDPFIMSSRSGTDGFKAPEYMTWGEPPRVHPTKDIYALGMLLLMLLRPGSSSKPSSHTEAMSILTRCGFNPKTTTFLERCLERDTGKRFQNGSECLNAFNLLPITHSA